MEETIRNNKALGERPLLQRGAVIAVLAIICCLFWGSAFPSIKTGYRLLDIGSQEMSEQLLFAGMRFFTAGIMVILLRQIMGMREGEKGISAIPAKSEWKKIAVIAATQTVGQYFFYYIALAHLTGVRGAIISSSGNFLAIVFAVFLFHQEPMRRNKAIGCLLGFLGAILVNATGASLGGSVQLLGEGAMTMSVVMYGLAMCLFRKMIGDDDAVRVNGWQFLVGGSILIVIAKAMGARWFDFTPKSFLLLLYMGLISAAAYTIWNLLMKYNPVSRVAIYGFGTPLFGALLSALILGEGSELGVMTFLALALVSIGIVIANRA